MIDRHDFVPDFVLPTPDGPPARFYGAAGGLVSVLVFAPGGDSGGRVAELAALAGELDAPLFVVYGDVPNAPMSGATAFVDREGVLRRRCGVGDSAVAFALDENLRVARRADDPDAIREGVAAARAAAPDEAASHAPVLLIPHALDAGACAELIELWDRGGHEATGVEVSEAGRRSNEQRDALKRRRDHIVDDPDRLADLTKQVARRITPEVHKAFSFHATRFEGFKIGCYDAGDRGLFRPHRDNLSPATAHRRFALSLNLNDDYDGGELRFPEYGPRRYRPAAGGAIVFSGSLLHEALPVTRGRRFVLVSFLYRPEDGRRGKKG